MITFGRIRCLWGEKQSRFPYANTIFVDDEVRAVIDPGAGAAALEPLGRRGVDLVINSHYHFDHIRFNYLFLRGRVWVNRLDREALSDLGRFAAKYGALRVKGAAWIDELAARLRDGGGDGGAGRGGRASFTYDQGFYRAIGKVDATYGEGARFSFGRESLEVVHLPGHSDSMCGFLFPRHSLCYVADYNVLSDWGPWYGGADSDIAALLASARKLVEVGARHYLTAHDQVVLDRDEFRRRLQDFLAVIDQRNQRIQELIREGLDFGELAEQGLFYEPKYFRIPWVRIWETTMLLKHLEYLGETRLIPPELRE